MFSKGQCVVCGNKGVCTIEDIVTLDIPGVDKEKLYYTLKPVYVSGSTVYVPVESSAGTIRKALTKEEAEELICNIPRIESLEIINEKFLEREYKEGLRSNCCEDLVKLIKTIYLRKQKRLETGKKETAVDSKYFRIAEDNLYGELAVALDMERSEVGRYIEEQLQKLEIS